MGWESIPPGVTSAAHELQPGPAPAAKQTALAGHKVEAARPEGFRQRITRAFQQFGRKLSSLVSAPPSGPRAPDRESLERGTRKQLVSLLNRLDSADFNEARLGADLDTLAEEKQRWMEQDPDHGGQQFDTMVRNVLDQRWPGKNVLHLEKALIALSSPALSHLPQPALRKQLVALVGGKASDYRAVQGCKAHHQDEIHRMGFAVTKKTVQDIFWKGAALSAALKAFEKAEKACEYKPGATVEELQAARDALEDAGNHLLETLEATHPRKAEEAKARRLYADQNQTAIYLKARNQAQANLYAQFAGNYFTLDRDIAAITTKTVQAKNLRAQIAQNPQRPRGAPRSAEEQYFVALRKKHSYLDTVKSIAAPEDDSDMKEFFKALERLPTSISGSAKDAAGAAPDYAEALQVLNQAVAAGDRKVAALTVETIDRIARLEQQDPSPERASDAQKLVMGTNRAVLKNLPVREQIKLLNLIRGDLKRQPSSTKEWKPFLDAQSKLYHAMGTRPELKTHQKQLRRDVMNALTKDKKMLQDARDLWHTYTLVEKRAVLKRVAQVHSEVLGCDPPDVLFDPESKGCRWQPDERLIVIGTASGNHMDFEHVMNSLFHENTHNWQHHLAKELTGADSVQHVLHEQALIFKENLALYADSIDDYFGYRLQPVELHAFYSGRVLAADLMRTLASQGLSHLSTV